MKMQHRLNNTQDRVRHMFETRSHSWREVGLARQLSKRAARRARIQLLVLGPMLAGVLLLYNYRRDIFGPGYTVPVRIFTAIALIMLGWQVARDIGRSFGPTLFRRLDPATAGTVGFLIRLVTMLASVVVALRYAGLTPSQLALGGAFTAVVFGLAAQQTLGNLMAGTVLLSARPFRVGERIRIQGGGLAGSVEGIVASLGLLFTTLAEGEDAIMVPNSVVLSAAIMPLREPASVDVRARVGRGVKPSDLQDVLEHHVSTPLRGAPHIGLEEVDGDEVVMRIEATPETESDGPMLADEVLAAIADLSDGRPQG
jgi:small-conductance mechanosensitive channel